MTTSLSSDSMFSSAVVATIFLTAICAGPAGAAGLDYGKLLIVSYLDASDPPPRPFPTYVKLFMIIGCVFSAD